MTIQHQYESILHLSDAISACSTPEQLAGVLAQELDSFLAFDYLDLLIFKDESAEIEWHAVGRGPKGPEGVPVEELTAWHVFTSQEPLHIKDWKTEDRFPRLKQLVADAGVEIGSVVLFPLTTAFRKLGTLAIASRPGVAYSDEDICFIRLVVSVVAYAIDDALHLRWAETAQNEVRRQNERLELLLEMTKNITSNLDLRGVLRSTSASLRKLMQGDVAAVALLDSTAGSFRLYAHDFPLSKGFVQEDQSIPLSGPGREALETMQPVITTLSALEELTPDMRAEMDFLTEAKSICMIPIVNHGRALGLLSITRATEQQFASSELDFLTQVAGSIAIAIENAVAYEQITELKDKLAQERLYLEDEIRSELGFEQIIGDSLALRQVLAMVETVAESDSTVLLLGETGTGKELIARAIHERSKRKGRTFVKLNCAAIPTGLLESELFGHEKGAFTGAINQKVGRMELADQGTLFLDEVGDIPLEIQPKLLRALQEREFERLGSTHTRRVNIRLVAATNRDLEQMIADREFRSDLFYRLNVFPIRIPPLRERRDDIPLLTKFFVQKCAKQMQKRIDSVPTSILKGLMAWDWPGNIRELENFIERAVILTRGRVLEAPLSELRKIKERGPVRTETSSGEEQIARIVKETIDSMSPKSHTNEFAQRQREEILHALTVCKGRVGGPQGAAARLSLPRTTLICRMKKLGINPYHFA